MSGLALGEVYTLERDGEVLGTLTVTGADMFQFSADFTPTPAFAPYRPLFDEDARLAQAVADDPDPARMTEAEAALDQLQNLSLTLRGEHGTGYREFLLSIEGASASFRPLHPEPVSLEPHSSQEEPL